MQCVVLALQLSRFASRDISFPSAKRATILSRARKTRWKHTIAYHEYLEGGGGVIPKEIIEDASPRARVQIQIGPMQP